MARPLAIPEYALLDLIEELEARLADIYGWESGIGDPLPPPDRYHLAQLLERIVDILTRSGALPRPAKSAGQDSLDGVASPRLERQ